MTSARPRAIVEGDETYVTLLLENLLSNAVKYSPAGSPVEVAITTVGDEVMVEVLDRGIGLGDIDGERLFEPFFRAEPAKSAANGLGIGLALCQRIVAALGGRIWARAARRRRRGGRFRAADRGGRSRSVETAEAVETARRDGPTRSGRATSSPGLTEPSAVQSPFGQIGGLGGWLGSASQSARVGAKMSMTTAPSGPTLTWCGVSDGIRHVPPGPS